MSGENAEILQRIQQIYEEINQYSPFIPQILVKQITNSVTKKYFKKSKTLLLDFENNIKDNLTDVTPSINRFEGMYLIINIKYN
jgi:thymidine kinase